MRIGTFFTKSAEQLQKRIATLENTNKLLALSKNTPNFTQVLSSNGVGCLTDAFRARSIENVYSLSYVELPSNFIPFHAAISGRNTPTVGRWIRKHVIDDDNLGELPDFTRWNENENKGTGVWSGRRSRNVALPSQLNSDALRWVF